MIGSRSSRGHILSRLCIRSAVGNGDKLASQRRDLGLDLAVLAQLDA